MDKIRNQPSGKDQNSSNSDTQMSSYETEDPSKNIVDSKERLGIQRQLSNESQSSSDSETQMRIHQTKDFSIITADLSKRLDSQRQPSSKNQNSSDSDIKISSGQKTDISENIKDLNERQQSLKQPYKYEIQNSPDRITQLSFNLSELSSGDITNWNCHDLLQYASPESKSTEAKINEMRDFPQTSNFHESSPMTLFLDSDTSISSDQKIGSSEDSFASDTQLSSGRKRIRRKMFSSEDITDLLKRIDDLLHVSTESVSNSTEAKANELWNIPQPLIFHDTSPMTSPDSNVQISSYQETDSSENIRVLNEKRKSQKQPSKSENQNASNSCTQLDFDQTKVFESVTCSNESLELSRHVSKEPELKSPEAEKNEQCNNPQTSNFYESRAMTLSRRSTSKVTPYSQSKPRNDETLKCMNKSVSTYEKTVDPKHDVVIQRPPLFSRGGTSRRRPYSDPNTQCFLNTVPPSYHPQVNHTLLSRNINPVNYQASVNQGQYPEQSPIYQNIVPLQNINGISYQSQTALSALSQNSAGKNHFFLSAGSSMHPQQWQFPQPNIRTTAQPVYLLSKEYYRNPMPPIRTKAVPLRYVPPSFRYGYAEVPVRTNARPLQYVQHSAYYKHPMSPVRTNASPLRLVQPSSHHQNLMSPFRKKTVPMRYHQFPRTSTPNVSGPNDCPTDALQSRFESTCEIPDQIPASPVSQPKNSAPVETDIWHPADSNQGQSKELTKLERLAHSPNKNILKVKISTELPPTSLFPLHLFPWGGIVPRLMQKKPVRFSTPSNSHYFESGLAEEKGIISHPPYQHISAFKDSTSYDYSYVNPEITDQTLTELAAQNIQSGSYAINPIHLGIQARSVIPYEAQYQTAMQNQNTLPQYQDPNPPIYQHGTQTSLGTPWLTDNMWPCPVFDSSIPLPDVRNNVFIQPESHAINPMNLGIQAQSATPYEIQYQPVMQNQNALPQYQDSFLPIYQYGAQTFSGTTWPNDIILSCPTSDASITDQQNNPNIVPEMETSATNSSLISIDQTPTLPDKYRDAS